MFICECCGDCPYCGCPVCQIKGGGGIEERFSLRLGRPF
jgi:hypothetical protein